jgi:hypothetical protein
MYLSIVALSLDSSSTRSSSCFVRAVFVYMKQGFVDDDGDDRWL